MNYDQFKQRLEAIGLSTRQSHPTHWQVFIEGDLLIEVWPTADKWKEASSRGKAKYGRISAAIEYAEKYVRGCQTKPRLPHELVTEVPLYNEPKTPDLHQPTMEQVKTAARAWIELASAVDIRVDFVSGTVRIDLRIAGSHHAINT